ncbi:MAG TPA: bacteriohopanetetrol glucosamine biosynthesis glycosyltransferase HpnI [Caulobacteraceae bacterium]|jgi:ceramide glucosyltransferase
MDTILPIENALGWTTLILSQLGVLYMLVAALVAPSSFARAKRGPSASPPVTIIKPLKGAPASLGNALERFCRQNYAGEVQILFGVHDADDPAIAVVRDVQRRHPELDIELRIDPRIHGANLKASNLINIVSAAKHEILVLSDADIVVGSNYLRTVVDTLAGPGVGLVTCYYVGEQAGGFWSQLSAMTINYQFIPGAILGKTLRLAQPCFGSTIALRAKVLNLVGGFAAFADHLADDYEIGRAVRRLGLKIAMPPMIVAHVCDEDNAGDFIRRELRWARAVRQVSPWGYGGSVITYPLPLILIATALLGPLPLMLDLVAAVIVLRICFKLCIDAVIGAGVGRWWLLPISDILAFGLFIASFGVKSVAWRGSRYRVSREGALLHP